MCQPEDVNALLPIKLALKYALRDYREEVSLNPTVRSHLAVLYNTLLEQNILRIVELYPVVEIEHVAQQVKQGRQDVEASFSPLVPVLYMLNLILGVDCLK